MFVPIGIIPPLHPEERRDPNEPEFSPPTGISYDHLKDLAHFLLDHVRSEPPLAASNHYIPEHFQEEPEPNDAAIRTD